MLAVTSRLSLSAVLLSITALPVLADGSLKDAVPADPAPAARELKIDWNLGVTSDYVFRGFSQNKGLPAIQGGVDLTYGIFYAGTWLSNVDFAPFATDPINGDAVKAPVENDWYFGFRPVAKGPGGDYNFDFGVIAYTYPGQSNTGAASLTYEELKAAVNHDIWKDGNLSQTFFWSPDYALNTGRVFTSETTFTQTLAALGKWVPSVSGTFGHQWGEKVAYEFATGNGSKEYSYYNAGVTMTYDSKLSFDLRYWGTDIKNDNAIGGFTDNFCNNKSLQCDNRISATLKYTY